jgi:hypothetical protein
VDFDAKRASASSSTTTASANISTRATTKPPQPTQYLTTVSKPSLGLLNSEVRASTWQPSFDLHRQWRIPATYNRSPEPHLAPRPIEAKMQQRQRGSSLSIVILIAANLLIPISILIFATGFFPYKPFLPGLARYEDLGYGPPPAAPFDRLIFMVVDALRRYCGTMPSGRSIMLTFAATLSSPTVLVSSSLKGP